MGPGLGQRTKDLKSGDGAEKLVPRMEATLVL